MSRLLATVSQYDLLLEWASEVSTGSWSQWCEAARQLRVEPNSAIQDFGALGHIEIDWSSNRFSCPPPTAAYIHRSSGCVFLTGARPRGFLATLDRLGHERDDLDFFVHPPFEQSHGPDTVLIEVDLRDTQELCEAAGLAWAFDPAGFIADSLDDASLETVGVPETWPPRDDVPREWFNIQTLRFEPRSADISQRGLWFYDGYRRKEAWLCAGDTWWMFPTREFAMYLAHPEVSFLKYRRTRSQLVVPQVAPLPPLQARAATLASGRLPVKAVTQGPLAWSYENVSETLARRIAESLSTELEVQA